METPSHTLYLRNLNEKIHHDRVKMVLYTAFSRFGSVLDVIVMRRQKLRGQAWVVFKEVAQATEAKKKMVGMELFGKEMDIHYSKNKSDIIAKMDGTFVPKTAAGGKRKLETNESEQEQQESQKKLHLDAEEPQQQQQQQQQQPQRPPDEPPHNILFATNLPADCPAGSLDLLFKQYNGYKESRMVPSRNVAFIEFDSIQNATHAKLGLDGFKLSESDKLVLTFAKK